MLFAFSRDGAVPGAKYWSRLNANRVPVYGVIVSAVVAVLITAPALVKVDIGGVPVPVAFNAVVSIGVIGLYVAFAIPIYLRWKAGDSFVSGNWTLGARYKWMCVVAVAEIAVTSFIATAAHFVGRCALVQGIRLVEPEVRQLHADRRRRGAPVPLDLVARVREELVHRSEDDDRPARRCLVGRRDRPRAPGQVRSPARPGLIRPNPACSARFLHERRLTSRSNAPARSSRWARVRPAGRGAASSARRV